jgi:bifunctional non-homologous end joining protein LigD
LLKIRGDEDNQWLLLKSDESIKAVTAKDDDKSIISGRTMKQIAADRDAEWQSNREPDPPPKTVKAVRAAAEPKKATPVKRRSGAKVQFVEPMKVKFLEEPPAKGEWMYELKFDGFAHWH